ncbi:hypothetical protein K443DRAFT_683212 [Laccaria amethystina LaAM-08-1]|uniref:Uncharacterized protein n=1 Tax=Laccaria amethystina LaAM-08-1 TaxID=1095629 RepID=A0A0C9XBN1_9AGAR|nr:hypothetical protein K443DRAFT_683212 [Laccaria amethystina LaAM-08-1]
MYRVDSSGQSSNRVQRLQVFSNLPSIDIILERIVMKVISISTFVALAALVQSSSALWCDCYLRFSHGESTLFDQYDAELSQKFAWLL